MLIRTILAGVLIISGCLLILISSLGVIRFPDFYSRLHPAGKSDTMGQTMVLLGLIIFEGFDLISVKLIIIMIFFYVANPTATHFISKAAHKAGLPLWQKQKVLDSPAGQPVEGGGRQT